MDGSASPAGLVVAACAQIISDLHKCCCSPASAPPPLTNRQDRRRRKATASGVLEGQPQTYPSPGTRSLQPDSSCAPVLLLPPPSQPGAQQQHLPLGNHSGEQHTVVVKDVTQGAILADPAQPKQGHCYEEAAAGHAPVSVIDIMVAELQQKHGCQGMQSCPGSAHPLGHRRLSWPAHEDALVAAGVRALLQVWYPRFSRCNSHQVLGPAHLRRASTAAWASLQAHGQAAAKTSAREVVALVRHVVGDAPPCAAPPDGHALAPGRLLGAAGLAWLVQLRWRAPAGRASAPPGAAGDCAGCDIVLTDGLGVFLVVVVEHLGLIKTPRGRKRVEAFARQEDRRRYERRRAIRAAVAAAQAFQAQHPIRVVHAFAGVCLSHAEGLDIVAAAGGAEAKEQQLKLARVLIPGLCTGPLLGTGTGPACPALARPGLLGMLLQEVGLQGQASLHGRHGRPSSSSSSTHPPARKAPRVARGGHGEQASAAGAMGGADVSWLGMGMVTAGVACGLGVAVGLTLAHWCRQASPGGGHRPGLSGGLLGRVPRR